LPTSPDAERAAWDRRYREGSHSSSQPDRFLVQVYSQFIEPLFPRAGTALDLAGGVGRHAIFLAERGWQVTLLDISTAGVERARALADKQGVQIDFVIAGTREFQFAPGRFDLVVVFFYLEREHFTDIAATLRPGGLVVYKTYTREHQKFAARGLSHPMYFLNANELLHAFPGFIVLHYSETVRDKGIAELIARKPA
jgi:SAM-dependent methyltransferase